MFSAPKLLRRFYVSLDVISRFFVVIEKNSWLFSLTEAAFALPRDEPIVGGP